MQICIGKFLLIAFVPFTDDKSQKRVANFLRVMANRSN